MTIKFNCVEGVWFMRYEEVKQDGARFTAGLGDVERPCNPINIISNEPEWLLLDESLQFLKDEDMVVVPRKATEEMKAVIRNERCVYGDEAQLWADLITAAWPKE